MITFREFWDNIVLVEMAVGAPVSIFDDDDKRYYRYIYNHLPDSIRDDDKLLRSVIRQAIYYRYGRPKESGRPTGVLHEPEFHDQETMDLKFNLNGREFTIPNVPMNTQNLIAKFDQDWRWSHRDFGYGKSSWNPLNKTAGAYITWLRGGKEPTGSDVYFSGKYKHIHKSYPEDLETTRDKREGVRKTKAAHTTDFTRKLNAEIPLDADDNKFLDNVREQFIKNYIKPNQSSDPEVQQNPPKKKGRKGIFNWQTPLLGDEPKLDAKAEESVMKVLARALTMRYSNTFVTQDDRGNFVPRNDGQMYGDIHISGVKIPGFNHIVLKDVYLNVPRLAEKFKKYRDIYNFVKEPLSKNAAERWLDHEKREYRPQHGLVGGSFMPDNEFLKIISQDHDAWRKGMTQGRPVKDEELAEKLTWRRGDQIVESPNIEDMPGVKRDIRSMTWDEILHDDAERAVKEAIDLLGRTKFITDKNFKTRVQPVYDEILQDVVTELMFRKTGMGDQYRSESRRIRWGNNAAVISIKRLLAPKDAAGKGKEEEGEHSIDPRSRESAPNMNVIAPEIGDEPEPEFEKETDPNWDAEVSRMTRQSAPQGPQGPQKPAHIPMLVWMKAKTPEEKQKLIQQYATNKV